MRGCRDRNRGLCVATTRAALLLIVGMTMTAAFSDGASANGQRANAARRAHAARTIDGTDTAHLRLMRQYESLLFEEGATYGALPGRMKARLTVGSVFKGACTIYTSRGSITGRGVAKPHGAGRYQSFRGTFTVTGGTGRYRHVHGRTQLYGTFDRRTFAVVVQTVGRLSY